MRPLVLVGALVAATALFALPAHAAPGGVVVTGDVSGDGYADIIATKPDGTLWYYGNNWNADHDQPYTSGKQIGTGWSAFNQLTAGDVNGDGHDDLVVTKPDGSLWYYGNNWNLDHDRPYTSGRQIGADWTAFNTIILADVSGDGFADLVAAKPDGTLWYYGNNWNADRNRPYTSGRQIGTGWAAFNHLTAGDVSGDNHDDLVATKPDGTLWLYGNNWNADRANPFGGGKQIGTGWQPFDRVTTGDVSGDGFADLVATKPEGTLWLYGNNWNSDNDHPFGGGKQIGSGWSAFTVPPRTDDLAKPVYFIHGFRDTDTAFSGTAMWDQVIGLYQYGSPGLTQPSRIWCYYSFATNCTATTPGSTLLPIKYIAAILAKDIWDTYTSRGIPVDVVAHSMGGLVIRAALTGVQRGEAGFPPYLFVEDVTTISTPHSGSLPATLCAMNTPITQCSDMASFSAFRSWLYENPQGLGGTDWTLIGAYDDGVVGHTNALGMAAAAKVRYGPGQQLGHMSLLNATSGKYVYEECLDAVSDCSFFPVTGVSPMHRAKLSSYSQHHF